MNKSKLFGFDKKKAAPKVIQFVIRSGAAVGAAYLSHTVIGDKINKKFHGPGLALIGLAAEMFIEEPTMAAAAQGIATYGALKSAGQFGLQNQIGIAGVEDTVSGIGAPAFDWKTIADEAERIASKKDRAMAGTEDNVSGVEDNVSGLEEIMSGSEEAMSGNEEGVSGKEDNMSGTPTENEYTNLLN